MAYAITRLYIEHIGEIRRFLTRQISCVEAAAELAHEVFIRYMAAKPESPILNPRAFLFRIASNLVGGTKIFRKTDSLEPERRFNYSGM